MGREKIDPEVKEAIEKFEADMKEFLSKVDGADGITVDWILITAQSIIGEGDFDDTVVGFSTNFNQPQYRTKGLLDQIYGRLQALDTAHIVVHHLED